MTVGLGFELENKDQRKIKGTLKPLWQTWTSLVQYLINLDPSLLQGQLEANHTKPWTLALSLSDKKAWVDYITLFAPLVLVRKLARDPSLSSPEKSKNSVAHIVDGNWCANMYIHLVFEAPPTPLP